MDDEKPLDAVKGIIAGIGIMLSVWLVVGAVIYWVFGGK